MDDENFNRWTVKDLKEYLLQYDIVMKDIKGTGKNGNVVKNDLIHAIKKLHKNDMLQNDVSFIGLDDLPNLNNDILINIAIKLPIDDVQQLTMTNKDFYNIYSSPSFWVNKYNYDNLPLLEKHEHIADWINDYKATKNAKDLIWLNKTEADTLNSYPEIIIQVNNPTQKQVYSIPLPNDIKNNLSDKFINYPYPMKQYRVILGTDVGFIMLNLYFDRKPIEKIVQLRSHNNTPDDIFKIVKFIFLNERNDNLRISDGIGISYNTSNISKYVLNTYSDIINLRKTLMSQHNINFELKEITD
jgi:hypothetical protein